MKQTVIYILRQTRWKARHVWVTLSRRRVANRLNPMRRPVFVAVLSCAFLLLGALPLAHAQGLQVQLSVSPHPSMRLSDWQSRREIATVSVTNTTTKSMTARLVATLELNGSTVASTRTESMPVLDLPPGRSSFYGGDMFPANAIVFSGDAKTSTLRTGMLPEGTYELCVYLVSAETREIISTRECHGFFLTSYSLPQLLQPANAATVTAGVEASTLFSWTPVVPAPSNVVVYRVRVVELRANQNAKQAILNERPFFERTVTGVTQLLWPSEYPLPSDGGDFAWTVQAEDPDGTPINMPERYAEPFTFSALPSQEECLRLLVDVDTRKDSLLAVEEAYWRDYATMTRIRKELSEAEDRADVYEINRLEPELQLVESEVRVRSTKHDAVRAFFDAAMQKYKRCIGR